VAQDRASSNDHGVGSEGERIGSGRGTEWLWVRMWARLDPKGNRGGGRRGGGGENLLTLSIKSDEERSNEGSRGNAANKRLTERTWMKGCGAGDSKGTRQTNLSDDQKNRKSYCSQRCHPTATTGPRNRKQEGPPSNAIFAKKTKGNPRRNSSSPSKREHSTSLEKTTAGGKAATTFVTGHAGEN